MELELYSRMRIEQGCPCWTRKRKQFFGLFGGKNILTSKIDPFPTFHRLLIRSAQQKSSPIFRSRKMFRQWRCTTRRKCQKSCREKTEAGLEDLSKEKILFFLLQVSIDDGRIGKTEDEMKRIRKKQFFLKRFSATNLLLKRTTFFGSGSIYNTYYYICTYIYIHVSYTAPPFEEKKKKSKYSTERCTRLEHTHIEKDQKKNKCWMSDLFQIFKQWGRSGEWYPRVNPFFFFSGFTFFDRLLFCFRSL